MCQAVIRQGQADTANGGRRTVSGADRAPEASAASILFRRRNVLRRPQPPSQHREKEIQTGSQHGVSEMFVYQTAIKAKEKTV